MSPAGTPLLLCASPRAGNSLAGAALFRAGFNRRAAAPLLPPALRLRDYPLAPCLGCEACARPDAACPQAAGDKSAELFRLLLAAPLLALASPVYFYHLPAQLKALLDRCQFHYRRALREKNTAPPRPAFIMLIAARRKGRLLFQGSLLSLRLALGALNFRLEAPLLLRGLDGPEDLTAYPETQKSLELYGEAAWEKLTQGAVN